MKILVTGGAGFIGSNLVKKLVESGHEIVVLDTLLRGNKLSSELLKKVKLVVDDVRNLEIVDEVMQGCDIVFHFAAVLGVDIVADNPVETMEVEVNGTQNIVKLALKHKVKKILYASTSGIYGHSAMESAVTEEVMVDPRTSYAMAKRYNEIYLASNYEEKGLESICLRFFNVYGYNQDNRMVIPRFIEQAKANEPITVFGNGAQTRDFTFIDDTLDACIRLMDVGGFHIVNISNENEYSILDLAHKLKELLHSQSEIKFIEAPIKRYDYEVERRVGNSDKLFRLTGLKPNTNLEDGLLKIISKAQHS